MRLLLLLPEIHTELMDDKPVFEKRRLVWEEDMKMHSKFLDRKLVEALLLVCGEKGLFYQPGRRVREDNIGLHKDSSEEETEKDEERSRRRLRCYQGDRDSPDDEPSELGAAITATPEPLPCLVSLHCSPQHLLDSSDLEVELTAEVRVEGSSLLSILSTVTPGIGSRKTGLLFDPQPSASLLHPQPQATGSTGLQLAPGPAPILGHGFNSNPRP
ncbi:hypothetical protein J4Q44_G00169920 [Coregonus suidteri]|uniref:Insulin-like domain-containing protein n=1 Tax=Coregonus suidteri TaxID=861788 RepID=A0AAN8QUI1_9TELE